QGDALVHSTRKSLTEYGDKLEDGEKEKIEAAIKKLEDALKDGDKTAIDEKSTALTAAAQTLGDEMYTDMQAQTPATDGTASADGADFGGAQEEAKPQQDDAVDADFKEVKDNK